MHVLNLAIMVGVGIFLTLFWDFSALLPVKLLSVLVHEIWHGLVAMLNGGTLESISIVAEESGETAVKNLNGNLAFYLSVSAGYIGTAVTGVLFLNRAIKESGARLTLITFTVILWYISYIFTDWGSVAFFTGIGWALFFTLMIFMGNQFVRYTMIVVGTIFIWYCFFDTLDFERDLINTDAGILSRFLLKKNPEWSSSITVIQAGQAISIIWILIMMLTVVVGLRFLLQKHDKTENKFQYEKEPTGKLIAPERVDGKNVSLDSVNDRGETESITG